MRTLKTLSKVVFVTLLITGLSVDASAQKKKKGKKEKTAKVIERPAKVGNGDVDAFVTSSFDIYEKNQEISKKLGNASDNAADMGDVKGDLDKQMEEVKGLLGKSGDALKGAKAITPKTDSMKAVKAINSATKALNATQAAIPGQLEMIKTQSAK